MANPESLTGRYLRGDLTVTLPPRERKPKGFLTVVGARKHNLKGITAPRPARPVHLRHRRLWVGGKARWCWRCSGTRYRSS
ncbi:MAG: hypothetical protein KatS3mg082_1182 [Nitrospiraceae bacterium]|nr:MAG: hypothetical protein KatS3mg082_1182 [Nitrospiraceae bacterium]